MPDRSWFFASNGQQQGPYGEAQLRDMIARGAVQPDTLVWSEGMSGWQKAGEIPGLMAGDLGSPALPHTVGPAMDGGHPGGGPLSIELGIWELTWRSIVYLLGVSTVVLMPWTLIWFLKWIVSCVHVPNRPNLSFMGNAMTIVPWFAGIVVLFILTYISGIQALHSISSVATFVAFWFFIKWQVANVASNGQLLGLSFSGSIWAYLGWNLLLVISFITVIGWAWVYAAQMRWFCRNIQGTRRAVVFQGTGLQILWRLIVVSLVSALIIPIPWMYRWMMRWLTSQTILIDKGTPPRA